MQVDNIRLFLKANYSYEQLCALQAHIESGKFSYNSCDCLVGIPTAPHALRGMTCEFNIEPHLQAGRNLPHALLAEREVWELGRDGGSYGGDPLIRERLLPLVIEEIAFRDRLAENESMAIIQCDKCGVAHKDFGQ